MRFSGGAHAIIFCREGPEFEMKIFFSAAIRFCNFEYFAVLSSKGVLTFYLPCIGIFFVLHGRQNWWVIQLHVTECVFSWFSWKLSFWCFSWRFEDALKMVLKSSKSEEHLHKDWRKRKSCFSKSVTFSEKNQIQLTANHIVCKCVASVASSCW